VLDASARSDGTLPVNNGQTLTGNGSIVGSLRVDPGGTLSPGSSIGALTVSGAVMLRGTAFMELDKANGTNDSVRGATSVNYGGTLSLGFVPGSLAAGDSFLLFNAAAYSGAFTNLVPSTPGAGLVWSLSSLNSNGVLRVATVSGPVFESVSLVNNGIAVSGSGGTPFSPYYVLSGTNVDQPLVSWLRIATNNFDSSGAFAFTNAIVPGVSRQFFRLQLP